MKRTHPVRTLLAAAIALNASLAQALGLGDITLRSALDEPLNAEIRLRGAGDLSSDQIIVNLASEADFERAGVDRLYSLTEMRFEVELLPNGDGRVQLRTERPVREPYLDFVVEVRWPTGRVLREYTVLLDLPTTRPAPAPVVRAAASARSAGGAADRAVSGGGSWDGGDSIAVRSGDTLWSIASRTRPAGVSVQQMLVALHRDNPEAFIRGNMNLLRAGAVLRIPAQPAVSHSEAVGEVAAQGRDWRSGGETIAPAETPAPAGSGDAGSSETERAYLELAAGSSAGEGTATGGVEGGSGNAPMPEQLTSVQESLSAKERENAELQSRVQALEEQVEDYQRLVEIESADGAAAQQSAAAEPAAPSAPAPAAPSTPAAADTTATEPGWFAKIFDNALLLASTLGLLVLAVVGFLFLRQRASGGGYVAAPEPEYAARKIRTVHREEPAGSPDPMPMVRIPEAPAAVVAAAVVAPEPQPTAARPPVPEPEHRDPVDEAEIFVAYGRVERAIEVLRGALAQDPTLTDARLKLMDLLADRGEQDEFIAEYDQLAGRGDAAAEETARENLQDKGLGHWLAEIDEPLGVQSVGAEREDARGTETFDLAEPAIDPEPEPESGELARMEVDGDISALDAEITLDLDEELARAGAESSEDDAELALELGDLDLDGFDQGAAADTQDSFELELGELETAAPAPAVVAEVATAPLVEAVAPEPEPTTAQDDADLGLLEGSDEIETKLELARAYLDMGDLDGARDILAEVAAEGSEAQRQQANALMARVG